MPMSTQRITKISKQNKAFLLQQEYVTNKLIIKKYREFYITLNDLRYESNKRKTITILYESKNKIKDFWIFSDTILIKEQKENDEMTTLVLLSKKDNSVINQQLIQIDHIVYTTDVIQIISNKILWLSYSAKDFHQLQSNILPKNQIQMSSNNLDQVAIVNSFSEITIWSTLTYQILLCLKNIEIIQYFKIIPNRDCQFYVADRDVLKFYHHNQVRFTIQLIKKRISIVTNTWDAIHHIYQIEDDKITLNSMNEDSKIINWKKVIFELDSIRESINCLDNKEFRLIYFSGQKLQQSSLDSFDTSNLNLIVKFIYFLNLKLNRKLDFLFKKEFKILEIMNKSFINYFMKYFSILLYNQKFNISRTFQSHLNKIQY